MSSESKRDAQYASYREEESILILSIVLAGLSIELAWDTWTEKKSDLVSYEWGTDRVRHQEVYLTS